MKLKNIVIFFPNFTNGGIEKISVLLSNYFVDKKLKINFISFKNPSSKKYRFSKKIKFFYSNKNKENFFYKNLYCMYLLFKILNEHNRKDTIVFSLQNNILSTIICKFLDFKIVLRNSAPIDYFKKKNLFTDKVKLMLKMKIYSYSDLIISNSKSSAKKIKDRLRFSKKTFSIPNPIFKTQTKINKLKKSNKLLYVGRISKEKGVFQLIEGFDCFHKDFPNYRLDIVGDGHEKKNLLALIKNKNLSKKIKIIGWSNRTDRYYKLAKLLILPSEFEGFGNVLIEALNFNLPCIATRNDGPKEILGNGKYGFLMKDNKSKTIDKSLRYLIKNYETYRLKAIAGLRNNKKYHINLIGSNYLSKINSVLK